MKKLALALALATFAVTLPAAAGERTAVSAVPRLPAVKDATTPPPLMGVPGLKVTQKETPHSKYVELEARRAQGYCLVSRDVGFQLNDSTTSTEDNELWRFSEADGKATLERIRFEVAIEQAWVKSKASVELRALAKAHGVTVWGMRETNGDLIVLVKDATGGVEANEPPKKAEDVPLFRFASSSCTFAATRIQASIVAKGGAAQLTGELPAEGEGKSKIVPRFVVDVSTSKVSRDPEPVLSVRVRRMDPSS
ncbi:MAG: hypothetical protein KIT84_34505 [Labilithrix sp.]|nr:hypothetical protein [Labilithrix sp.]MCW5816160.1 hypothetical protein [Labilithrix sp.]